MTSHKNILAIIIVMMIITIGGNALAQLDSRFGAGGVEGTKYLGQKGLQWYRDWEDSYQRDHFPPTGKDKLWTVGKIDYRSDKLGMDYKWYVLDLLESTDVDLMQNFFNLCLAVVNKDILPMLEDYWSLNRDSLETTLEDTLNTFVFVEVKYGIKYRAKCKNTNIAFQDTLPEFKMTVIGDTLNFNTSIAVDWTTHIYIQAWVLNPNPFRWGYHWKNIGDANCKFRTTISLDGKIGLGGLGRERYLQISKIITNSKTESDIDWTVLGIPFTWEDLSNELENLVDKELEKTMNKELNKEEYKQPYYFVDYFKSLFPGEIVPTQQEILDRIFAEEKQHIETLIIDEGVTGGYWSIGSEPNWYLKLRPWQYANFYTKYYRLIKGLDPRAKVLGPPLFLTEAVKNPADMVYLMIPGIFAGLLEGIKEEFTNLVAVYFSQADTKEWYRDFINHLPNDVKVDINDFHIYPLNAANTTVDWSEMYAVMDDLTQFMQNLSGAQETWVTEFGNRDWRRSEGEATELCKNLSQYFKTNTVGIQKWFWYLSIGHSPFFDIPMLPKPPKSALLNANFTLTQIGKAYLFAADNTPPIMSAAPEDDGVTTSSTHVSFRWNEAIEFDTGVIDYQLQAGTAVGDSNLYNSWIGKNLQWEITAAYGQTVYARVRAKNGAGLIGKWSKSSDGISIGRSDNAPLAADDPANEIAFDADGIDNSATELILQPLTYALAQNYPNPFNPDTYINYQLPQDCYVQIHIYNALGQKIRTLVSANQTAGYYTINWNGTDDSGNSVHSGVYFYKMEAGPYRSLKKMVLTK